MLLSQLAALLWVLFYLRDLCTTQAFFTVTHRRTHLPSVPGFARLYVARPSAEARLSLQGTLFATTSAGTEIGGSYEQGAQLECDAKPDFILQSSRVGNGTAYGIDELRLKGGVKVKVVLPPNTDLSISKKEQVILDRRTASQAQGDETIGTKSDLDILREELAKMLDNF